MNAKFEQGNENIKTKGFDAGTVQVNVSPIEINGRIYKEGDALLVPRSSVKPTRGTYEGVDQNNGLILVYLDAGQNAKELSPADLEVVNSGSNPAAASEVGSDMMVSKRGRVFRVGGEVKVARKLGDKGVIDKATIVELDKSNNRFLVQFMDNAEQALVDADSGLRLDEH